MNLQAQIETHIPIAVQGKGWLPKGAVGGEMLDGLSIFVFFVINMDQNCLKDSSHFALRDDIFSLVITYADLT